MPRARELNNAKLDKQHYVPQFLLKRFADDSRHVYVWDKSAGKLLPGTSEIIDFSYSRNLYTTQADQVLQNSEAETARIIRKKLRPGRKESHTLSASEFLKLKHFIVLLLVRSPIQRENAYALKQLTINTIHKLTPTVIMRRESINIPVTRRRLLEIVQRIDLFNDVIADPQGFIEEMTQVLDEMVLEHVVSPLGTEFIISDNPAFPRQLTLDESSGPVDLIYLPLSPKNALIFYRSTTQHKLEQVLGVNVSNALQLAGSIRYSFSKNKDLLIQAARDESLLSKQFEAASQIT